MSRPIILYGHASPSPNPWKVAIILEELQIEYRMELVNAVKSPPYIDKNPNGRVPAIEDPNTGITLWESGAIIEYLIDMYDKDSKLDITTMPEKYHLKQFLHFQMSGQGPYFGRASWFVNFHPEKVPSAVERYQNEAKRVTKVLDAVLKKNGDGYLVGGKCTYADLSFVTWAQSTQYFMKGDDFDFAKECPNYDAWMKSLVERPLVKKVLADRDAVIADSNWKH